MNNFSNSALIVTFVLSEGEISDRKRYYFYLLEYK